jgi:4-amino-4-deoxy-L-arabinose transferase-like glycosyltransferase
MGLSLFSLVSAPLWQVPDEPQHYQLARLVADEGHWPTLSDVWNATEQERLVYDSLIRHRFWEIRAQREPPPSLWAGTEPDVLLPPIATPPGYYVLAAGALRLVGTSDVDDGLRALRLLSALLGLLELLLVHRIARAVFPKEQSHSTAALAFAAFLPMRVYMTGGANSDALAALVAAGSLCAMAAWIESPLTPRRAACLGLLVGLALLTKRTTLFLVPVLLLFLVLSRRAGVQPASRRPPRWWLGAGIVLACLCAPLAAWTLARPELAAPGQAWPYPGASPGGLLGIRSEWLAHLFSAESWTWNALAGHARALGIAFASFWGVFGWLTVPLGLGWYAVLAGLTGIACMGLARRLQQCKPRPAETLMLCAAGLALLQLAVAAVAQGIPQQGRYLLPAIGPVACCLVMGWGEGLPERFKPMLPLAVGGGLLMLNALAWILYMQPAFYG